MERKPFVAVIGGPKAGKSTVIRSLTGCARGTPRHGQVVRDNSKGSEIYVIDKSPQESGLTLSELKWVLDRNLRSRSILGFVIATQPRQTRSRTSMTQIFETVSKRSNLRPIAVMLDPPYHGTADRKSHQDVQTRLGRFGINVRRIDGRRFAHLSACAIRKISNLP